jgi:hypothetical protein
MSEITSMLVKFEEPLCDTRDLIKAAWMAASYIEEDDGKAAMQCVLSAAEDRLSVVKQLWRETHEIARGHVTPDPIFAAIEAHREAYKTYRAAAKAADDDEEHPAAAEDKASDEAAVKLITKRPKTFEGAMALLDYFAEVDGNYVFPASGQDGDPFATCVVRNAARALRETVEA